MENVQPLNTVGGEDLLQMHLPPQQFIVEGLLPVGLAMIVGATKTGKSFLTLQLCLAVSQGEPLWNYPTKKGHVLYLALEDPWTRLQKRVLSMKGTASNFLQLSIDSETINKGLIEQIDDFLRQYPDTVLVAVDTFQHIRDNEIKRGVSIYVHEYEELMALQRYALKNRIVILLVHHSNKAKNSDPYEAASGTMGITAALDTYLFIRKLKRSDTKAMLHISGRDVGEKEFVIEKDDSGLWRMVQGDEQQEEFSRTVAAIGLYLNNHVWKDAGERKMYRTTPVCLVEDMIASGIEQARDLNPMNIKKDLNANADQLAKLGIRFDGSYRTGKERFLTFYPIEKKKEYSIVDIPKGIRLCSDVTNDTMTLENTDIQNDTSSVTCDSLPMGSNQVSQVSQPSQVDTYRIEMDDPIASLANVAGYLFDYKRCGIRSFEEFCRDEELKELKSKAIDVTPNELNSSQLKQTEKFVLSGKNKVDLYQRFGKLFVLAALNRC